MVFDVASHGVSIGNTLEGNQSLNLRMDFTQARGLAQQIDPLAAVCFECGASLQDTIFRRGSGSGIRSVMFADMEEASGET